jgi:hypothetical protein
VYGSELGILIDSSSNTPIHKLEIYNDVSTIDISGSQNDIIAVLSNSRILEGSNDDLL